jgi:hypothetical protein
MSIIEIVNESETQQDVAVVVKKRIVDMSTAMFRRMKQEHARIFNMLWNNPKATPQEILDQYGVDAAALFSFSSEIQTMAKAIDPGYVPLVSPYEYTINPDGTITVGDKIKT